MGHSLSADKRERQNIKRAKRNRDNKATLRRELKRVSAEAQKGADVKQNIAAAYKALDLAARKNAIPKKRADRKKSRMAKAINRAKAAAAQAPKA